MSIRWARAAPKTATFDTAQVIDFRDGVLSEYNEPVPHEVDETTATDLRRAAVLRAAALPPSRTRVAAQAAAAGLARMAAPGSETVEDNSLIEKFVEYLKIAGKKLGNGVQNVKEGGTEDATKAAIEVKEASEEELEAFLDTIKGLVSVTENGSDASVRFINGVLVKVYVENGEVMAAEINEDGTRKKAVNLNVKEGFEAVKAWWEKNLTEKVRQAIKDDAQHLTDMDKKNEEVRRQRVEDAKAGNTNSKFSLSQIKAVLPDAIADVQREMGSENDPEFSPEQLSAVVREVVSEMGVQQDETVSSLKLKEAVCSAMKSSSIKSAEPSLVSQGKLATVSSRPAPPATLLARLRPLD